MAANARFSARVNRGAVAPCDPQATLRVARTARQLPPRLVNSNSNSNSNRKPASSKFQQQLCVFLPIVSRIGQGRFCARRAHPPPVERAKTWLRHSPMENVNAPKNGARFPPARP
jgi:hypothetical protein